MSDCSFLCTSLPYDFIVEHTTALEIAGVPHHVAIVTNLIDPTFTFRLITR